MFNYKNKKVERKMREELLNKDFYEIFGFTTTWMYCIEDTIAEGSMTRETYYRCGNCHSLPLYDKEGKVVLSKYCPFCGYKSTTTEIEYINLL